MSAGPVQVGGPHPFLGCDLTCRFYRLFFTSLLFVLFFFLFSFSALAVEVDLDDTDALYQLISDIGVDLEDDESAYRFYGLMYDPSFEAYSDFLDAYLSLGYTDDDELILACYTLYCYQHSYPIDYLATGSITGLPSGTTYYSSNHMALIRYNNKWYLATSSTGGFSGGSISNLAVDQLIEIATGDLSSYVTTSQLNSKFSELDSSISSQISITNDRLSVNNTQNLSFFDWFKSYFGYNGFGRNISQPYVNVFKSSSGFISSAEENYSSNFLGHFSYAMRNLSYNLSRIFAQESFTPIFASDSFGSTSSGVSSDVSIIGALQEVCFSVANSLANQQKYQNQSALVSYFNYSVGQTTTPFQGSNSQWFSNFSSHLAAIRGALTSPAGWLVLGDDGQVSVQETRQTAASILSRGFVGLSGNLLTSLTGSFTDPSKEHSAQFLLFNGLDKNPLQIDTDNIMDAILQSAQYIQAPVSQLQAVLASDDDLELRKSVDDQVQQVHDQFTGDGQASSSASDVASIADVSGGFKSQLSGSGSVSDVFSVVGDSQSYDFFTQTTSDNLDTVGSVSLLSDDFDPIFDFSDYNVDENGFVTVKSPW